jgi:hypothetical protein
MALRGALIASVVIAVAVSATAFAQSKKRNQSGENKPPSQISQPESAKEKPQAQQPPIIVNVIPSPKTDAERAEEAEDRRQKAETDTKLANYTGELAFFTKGLFVATVILGIATIGLLIAAFFQSRDMKASIAAAEHANELNREIFVASHRPSLSADVALASDFISDGKSGAVEIQVTVRNVGDVPAFNITCQTLTFPNAAVGSEADHYRRLSDSMQAQNVKDSGLGHTLQRGGELQIGRGWTRAVWRKENIEIGKAQGAAQFGVLGLCVCVDYVSAVDERHYQIGFIYMLMMSHPRFNGLSGFDLDESNVPQDKLMLALHPIGSRTL